MILTIIFGALAGLAARPAEPRITEFLVRYLGTDVMPDPAAWRVASCLITLAAIAAAAALLGYNGSTFLFLVSALLAYFHKELREIYLSRQD